MEEYKPYKDDYGDIISIKDNTGYSAYGKLAKRKKL